MVVPEMREPTFLLLTALTGGPRHGYALISDVERLSEGRVRLRPGSLYGSIDRLTEDGFIHEVGTEIVDGRQRRYYDLTEEGLAALATQTQQIQVNLTNAVNGLRSRGVLPDVSGVTVATS